MFILEQDVDVMEEKYLIVHIINRRKWKTSTETIYRKDECALFPLENEILRCGKQSVRDFLSVVKVTKQTVINHR